MKAPVKVNPPPQISVGSDKTYAEIFLLLILLGLVALRSPTVKGLFHLPAAIGGKGVTNPVPWQSAAMWGGGAVLLVALTEVLGSFVIWFTLLLIVGEVLINFQAYQQLLQNGAAYMQGQTPAATSTSSVTSQQMNSRYRNQSGGTL